MRYRRSLSTQEVCFNTAPLYYRLIIPLGIASNLQRHVDIGSISDAMVKSQNSESTRLHVCVSQK